MQYYYKILAVVLIFFALTMVFAPYQPIKGILPIYNNTAVDLKGSSIVTFWGFSPYDAYDRILSIYYHNGPTDTAGTEVARIITPLHRDGTLPDSFKWTLTFPFTLPSKDANFSHYTFNTMDTYTVVPSVSFIGSLNTHIEALRTIDNQGWNILNTENTLFFQTYSPNERVFILISGHSLLEGRGDMQVKVDGHIYPVYNWHPIGNDADLTSTGVVIPYLGGPDGILMQSGVHTIVIEPQPQINGWGYLLISAFGVTYDKPTTAQTTTNTSTGQIYCNQGNDAGIPMACSTSTSTTTTTTTSSSTTTTNYNPLGH